MKPGRLKGEEDDGMNWWGIFGVAQGRPETEHDTL